MPKLNTTVKAVRIDNDKLAEIESRLGGQTFNAWFNEIIDKFLGGSVKKSIVNEGKPVIPNELEEIEGMVAFSGLTMKQFWDDIAYKLNEGVLMFTSTGTEVACEPWVEEMKDVCKDKGIPVEKAVQMVMKL